MTTIGRLNYKVTADTNQLNAAMVPTKAQMREAAKVMRETASPAERLQDNLNRLQVLHEQGLISHRAYTEQYARFHAQADKANASLDVHAGKLSTAKVAFGAFSLAITGIVVAFRQTMAVTEQMDQLSRRADALQESATKLRTLESVVNQIANIDGDQTAAMVTKLSQKIGEAHAVGGEASKVFERLGLSVNSLNSQSAVDQFNSVLAAIRNLESPSERIAAANKLFKDSGSQLLPVIMATNQALVDATNIANAQALGTENQLASFAKFDSAMDTLGARANGLKTTFAALGAEVFAPFVNALAFTLQPFRDVAEEARTTAQIVETAAKQKAEAEIANAKRVQRELIETEKAKREEARKSYFERTKSGRDALEAEVASLLDERQKLQMSDVAYRQMMVERHLRTGDQMGVDKANIKDAQRLIAENEELRKKKEAEKQAQTELIAERKKAEQDLARQKEQELQDATKKADEIRKKMDPSLAIKESLAEVEALLSKGLLTSGEAARAKRSIVDESISKDASNKMAAPTTATRGSVEEYKLRVAAEGSKDQAQLNAMKRAELLAKDQLTEIKNLSKKKFVTLANARAT